MTALAKSSDTVHVFVYVPACGHVPATNKPAVLTGGNVTSQLSVATGARACAAVRPAPSLHSTVLSRLPAAVVHVGAVLSVMVIVCVYTVTTALPQSSETVHVFMYVPA